MIVVGGLKGSFVATTQLAAANAMSNLPAYAAESTKSFTHRMLARWPVES